jgi:hypothetical protein
MPVSTCRPSRFCALVIMATAMCGCEQQPASSPSPAVAPALAPFASTPPRTFQPLHVRGRVLDGVSNPVAGARLTQWDTANRADSDASGGFDLTAMITAQDRTVWITVEKAGFETSEQARSVDTSSNTTLRLHQIRNIAAGDSFRRRRRS